MDATPVDNRTDAVVVDAVFHLLPKVEVLHLLVKVVVSLGPGLLEHVNVVDHRFLRGERFVQPSEQTERLLILLGFSLLKIEVFSEREVAVLDLKGLLVTLVPHTII